MKKIFLTFMALVAFSFVAISCGGNLSGGSILGIWDLSSSLVTNADATATTYPETVTNGLWETPPYTNIGTSGNVLKFEAGGKYTETSYKKYADSKDDNSNMTVGTWVIDGETITCTPYSGAITASKAVIENDTLTFSEFTTPTYMKAYKSYTYKKK